MSEATLIVFGVITILAALYITGLILVEQDKKNAA
jgi:hypothetical protein